MKVPRTHCKRGHEYTDYRHYDGKRRCKKCIDAYALRIKSGVPLDPILEVTKVVCRPTAGDHAVDLAIYWDNRLSEYAAKNGLVNTCREYGIEFKTVQALTGAV